VGCSGRTARGFGTHGGLRRGGWRGAPPREPTRPAYRREERATLEKYASVVRFRDDKSALKDGRQRLNDFLALLVFGGRAGLESTLNKSGIMFQKMRRDDGRQHRKEKPKNPRLAETHRPSGQKERFGRRRSCNSAFADLRSDMRCDSEPTLLYGPV
jgi:hypothetical protein